MSHMTAQFSFSALQNSERKDITVSCFPCLCGASLAGGSSAGTAASAAFVT